MEILGKMQSSTVQPATPTPDTAATNPTAPAKQEIQQVSQKPERPPIPIRIEVALPGSHEIVNLELTIDDSTGLVLGRLVDKETGEVIRQIPDEQAVRLAQMNLKLLGTLTDEMI